MGFILRGVVEKDEEIRKRRRRQRRSMEKKTRTKEFKRLIDCLTLLFQSSRQTF